MPPVKDGIEKVKETIQGLRGQFKETRVSGRETLETLRVRPLRNIIERRKKKSVKDDKPY